MSQIRNRVAKIEARQPPKGNEPITEIHRHIINPDGSPASNEDGTPVVLIKKIDRSD